MRIGPAASGEVLHQGCSAGALPAAAGAGRIPNPGVSVLDIVTLLGILAVFAVVGLIAKGVEKLGPPARGSARREAAGGEERG